MARARLRIRFRRDRGVWEVDYRDAGGIRRRPPFGTEEEALARAAEIRRTLARSVVAVPDPAITLAEYSEQWLATVAAELELATWRHYRGSLRRHILPTLGPLRLRDLRRRHVKAC